MANSRDLSGPCIVYEAGKEGLLTSGVRAAGRMQGPTRMPFTWILTNAQEKIVVGTSPVCLKPREPHRLSSFTVDSLTGDVQMDSSHLSHFWDSPFPVYTSWTHLYGPDVPGYGPALLSGHFKSK